MDHCAFCWTSLHTHTVSGVINQILSPICNHLHLRSLFYVWQFKFAWQSAWVCVKNCMWDTYTIWRIEDCARPCCSTEGVLLKTQTLSNIPPPGCNAYHRHTEKCTRRFMCSLLAVITASTAHLCSCLTLHAARCACMNVCLSKCYRVLLRNNLFQRLNFIKLLFE